MSCWLSCVCHLVNLIVLQCFSASTTAAFQTLCATRFALTYLSWRAKKSSRELWKSWTWSIVRFCVWVQWWLARMSFYYFQFFPVIINHCTTLNEKRGGEPLRFAILGVILYKIMHPTLYWCYTVESLVINKEQVQITCSASRCSQSLLSYFSAGFAPQLDVFPSSFLYPEPPLPIVSN